jgi:hypothetical protein
VYLEVRYSSDPIDVSWRKGMCHSPLSGMLLETNCDTNVARQQRRKPAAAPCDSFLFQCGVCASACRAFCFSGVAQGGQWAGSFFWQAHGEEYVETQPAVGSAGDSWLDNGARSGSPQRRKLRSVQTWHLLLLGARAFPWSDGQSTERSSYVSRDVTSPCWNEKSKAGYAFFYERYV